jgi:DNA invertase Pin-like site-specific DNA recombinase
MSDSLTTALEVAGVPSEPPIAAVARATREVAEARDRLTDAIVAARADGATLQAIADAAGVTRQAVWKTIQPPPSRKGNPTP